MILEWMNYEALRVQFNDDKFTASAADILQSSPEATWPQLFSCCYCHDVLVFLNFRLINTQ